jgi:hypothetical protein
MASNSRCRVGSLVFCISTVTAIGRVYDILLLLFAAFCQFREVEKGLNGEIAEVSQRARRKPWENAASWLAVF